MKLSSSLACIYYLYFHPTDCNDVVSDCHRFTDKCNRPVGDGWGDYLRKYCKKTCGFCGSGMYISTKIFNLEILFCKTQNLMSLRMKMPPFQ